MDLVVNKMQSEMDWLEKGLELSDMPAEEGGWAEYFQENDQQDMRIEDEQLRAKTAIILENSKQWLVTAAGLNRRRDSSGRIRIDETVRSTMVGGYSDYLFPVLRAAFPTNVINELVSVQPTTRQIATIMFWNYVYGTTKGGVVKGQRAYDATAGRQDSGWEYTSERINGETVTDATLTGTSTILTGTLRYHSGGGVRPNSVRIVANVAAAAREFYDMGNGTFTTPAGVTISASSINYQTGVFSITIAATTYTDNVVTAYYVWDSEGSCDLPEMDISISTTTVKTERRAIKLSYTIEAMQDMAAEMGIALEPQLLSLAAEELNQEIARQIISEIWAAAPVAANFPVTNPSTNFTQQQYFGDFLYVLNRAGNTIWERTQKAYANWIVVDSAAATMLESMPGMFQAAPTPANPQGVHYIGTLNNRYRVYKDLLLRNEVGASAYGNMLIGYKGNDFFDAGYVWMPYQMLYTTDSVATPCFTVSKGMATRYGSKMVNPNMYTRINLGA